MIFNDFRPLCVQTIIRAIHDSVPEELWDEILRKIEWTCAG